MTNSGVGSLGRTSARWREERDAQIEPLPDKQARGPASVEQAPPQRRRRNSPKGEARRKEILDSAMRLFAGGFNNVSLADIAQDVGMTQPGLLHHFPSKADLLLAVLIERDAKSSEEARDKRREGVDPLTSFLHTLQKHDRNPALVQLMALLSTESIAPDHPAHDWFAARYHRVTEEMTESLRLLLDEATLPPGVTAETIARWIVALADGLRIQWLHDRDSLDRGVSIAQFYDLLRPFLVEPYRSKSWVDAARRPTGE